ncbi:HPr family phosphocarrier protein [Kordiimonas sp. SCSIO 12610]|uniref:HPr family phosphocarrier protein n=1 Tax=Kordiimonas sp. SCSIO 12610 TaxID=2829597 RepID=UPI00210B5688|nr:HPr family phosphocarrier protein [Kordiimonas sp. SCSIO 12610]UTW55229.1 HPr family phosphocarrier protein [Kordiimonas sp. SCSIO 12610]
MQQLMEIVNRRGLHARASAKFAKIAGQFDADTKVEKNGTIVTATSIMGLMMLGAAKGDTISVTSTGTQSEEAIQALMDLVTAKFDEDE